MTLVDILFEKQKTYLERFSQLEEVLKEINGMNDQSLSLLDKMQTLSYLEYLPTKGYGRYAPSFKKHKRTIQKKIKRIRKMISQSFSGRVSYGLATTNYSPMHQAINHCMPLEKRLATISHYASLYAQTTDPLQLVRAMYDLSYAQWYLIKDCYLKGKRKKDTSVAMLYQHTLKKINQTLMQLQELYEQKQQKASKKPSQRNEFYYPFRWLHSMKEKGKRLWYQRLLPKFLPKHSVFYYTSPQ